LLSKAPVTSGLNSWWLAKVTGECFKYTGATKAVDKDGLRMKKNGFYLKVQMYSRTTVSSSSQFEVDGSEERTIDAEGVIYTGRIGVKRQARQQLELIVLDNPAETTKKVEDSLRALSV
jgi:hypothetical protein